MSLELRGEVIAAHPGGIGQRTDRDRAMRSFQPPACVLDLGTRLLPAISARSASQVRDTLEMGR